MTGWIVSSSVLIGAVALLRRALRGKISLRLQYALWALVLVRLLVPFQFGSSMLSVSNLTAHLREQPAVQIVSGLSQTELPRMSYRAAYEQVAEEYARRGVDVAQMTPKEYETVDYEVAYRMRGDVTPADVLRWVWLLGSAALALTFLICNLRFALRLRRSRQRLEGVSAPLPVYLSAAVETPCLFGLFRPAVYLTPETAADETVLRHALAHEITHFRHGDHVWSLLRCLCLAAHWYNPLVWLAASLSRRDGELACDEGTLARLGEGERAAYGNTLIDLTCGRRAGTSLFYTATTMCDGKKQLKERVMLIAKKPRTLAAAAIAVVLVCAAAVGCTFTGAREDGSEPPEGSAAPSGPVTTDSPGESSSPAPADGEALPEGIVHLCEATNDGRYLLLLSDPAREDGQDVFYLYDPDKSHYQPISRGDGLWEWPDYHAAVTEGQILYQTAGGRLFSIKQEGEEWTTTERTKSQDDPYTISPDGTTYAMRQGGTVKIFDLESDILLAETDAVSGVLEMEWSEDGSCLAMVTERGAGAAVWDIDTGAMFTYAAGQDPNTPTGWVDISRAYPVGDKFLLVSYLCETGTSLVIWDVEQDTFSDTIEAADNITILDIFGDAVLYEVEADGGGATLHTYHCSRKAGETIDRCEGSYTAGCLNTWTGQPLVFRYEAASSSPPPGDPALAPLGFTAECGGTYDEVGRQWARAYVEQYRELPTDSPLYSSETGSESMLVQTSVLSDPKRLVFVMTFTCRAVYPEEFMKYFRGWAAPLDAELPNMISFDREIVLEDAGQGEWTCIGAGTGGAGGWGYLDLTTPDALSFHLRSALENGEEDNGELIMRALPSGDLQKLEEEFGAEGWEKVLSILNACCLTEGRVYAGTQMWSDKYPDDQAYRDMYVILTAVRWSGASYRVLEKRHGYDAQAYERRYVEDLIPILKKQREYDPKSFDRCVRDLDPEQAAILSALID